MKAIITIVTSFLLFLSTSFAGELVNVSGASGIALSGKRNLSTETPE